MNSDPIDSYYQYWGKAFGTSDDSNPVYHLLPYHCLDVAAVGSQLLEKDPSFFKKIVPGNSDSDSHSYRDHISSLLSMLLAVHDIGKFSGRFQNLRPDLLKKMQGRVVFEGYAVRHDDMGYLILEDDLWPVAWENNWFGLDPADDPIDWKMSLRPWFYAVTGHHGQPPKRPDTGQTVGMLFSDDDRRTAAMFAKACRELFFRENEGQVFTFSEPLEKSFKNTSWLVAGLTVMSDWIGSNSVFFPPLSGPVPLEEYWDNYALPQAARSVELSGILPCMVSKSTGLKALFPDFEATPLQKEVSSCKLPGVPNMFILEDTTGSGKTEAALILAHRMMALGLGEGIFFGLPTMATADAMYGRMAEAYSRLYDQGQHPSLVLSHSARHLSEQFRNSVIADNSRSESYDSENNESATAECSAWLSDNRKKALLSQIGVGTIDQALMAVLPIRHQSLRLLGLSRNILVVDEVHAYDPYVKATLENLLEFHAALGGSAILLSATLPHEHRQDFIEHFCRGLGVMDIPLDERRYPCVVKVSCQEISGTPVGTCERTHRRVEVECTENLLRIHEALDSIVEEGRCACWVRNTIDDAIDAYRILSEKYGTDNVILFHARFAMGDRLKTEHKVLRIFGKDSSPEERKGKILIATQVVEQSLDLDFDLMITDLAPMDLIIQRSGRLHRHDRPGRGHPRLIVYMPAMEREPNREWFSSKFPRGAYVYPHHGELWLTARYLSERKQITMPDDARLLIEGVFGEPSRNEMPPTFLDQEGKAEGKEMSSRAVASLNLLHREDGYQSTPGKWETDAKVPTRLGDAQVTVLLLRWDGTRLSFWSSGSDYPEDMSQISISTRKLFLSGEYGGKLGRELEKFKDTLRDKGRWRVLIPLTESNGSWYGTGLDDKNNPVSVHYNSVTGFAASSDRKC